MSTAVEDRLEQIKKRLLTTDERVEGARLGFDVRNPQSISDEDLEAIRLSIKQKDEAKAAEKAKPMSKGTIIFIVLVVLMWIGIAIVESSPENTKARNERIQKANDQAELERLNKKLQERARQGN